MKIICMYLPQYHEVKENNEWWGDGYTEWTAVKKAKPLFKKHHQPNVPLDGYYNLDYDFRSTFQRQCELANEYGIYGFCFYHYWFTGKLLLDSPMEHLLNNKDIKINYSLCWANETWTRTWYGKEKEILIEQRYGDKEDWKNHFDYLLRFFKDERYILIDNKPMLHIYKSAFIDCLKPMMDYWNELAKEQGFAGIYLVVGNQNSTIETRTECFDAYYNFEPGYSIAHKRNCIKKIVYKVVSGTKLLYNKLFRKEILERSISVDELYKLTTKVCSDVVKEKKIYYGTFPMWDNTPRRGNKGTVINGSSPKKFFYNLNEISKLCDDGDFVYINAWNEWGEGTFLEPDDYRGYNYLEAIKEAVNEKAK